MAKEKVESPKRGRPAGKTKAASSPASEKAPPRRSPRKAVQTAKAVGADVIAVTSRVVKKAAPKKKASLAKAVAVKQSAIPVKKVAPAKAVAVKQSAAPAKTTPAKKTPVRKSPAKKASTSSVNKASPAKVAASSTRSKKAQNADAGSRASSVSDDFVRAFKEAKETLPTVSPNARKKGKKTATPKSSIKKSIAVKQSTLSAKRAAAPESPRRGRPPKDRTPEVSASRTASGRVTKATASPKKKTPTRTVVPAPETGEVWTDSPKKRAFPSKGKPKVPTGGASAVEEPLEAQSERPESPAKGRKASVGGVRESIEVPNLERGTRAQSRSKSLARATSKSSVRRRGSSPTAVNTGEADLRTTSPTGRKRSKSPAKKPAEQQTARAVSRSPSRRSSVQSTRTRSKTPAKSAPATTTSKAATRNASKSPSMSDLHSPVRVEKTRALRSSTRSPARSRQVSPTNAGSPSRRSKSPAKSPPKLRTPIPDRPGNWERSPPPNRTPEDFQQSYMEDSDYGQALREIEASTYKLTKKGEKPKGRNPLVTIDHERLARKRGIARAELESGIRKASNDKSQRAKDRADGRVVHKNASKGRKIGSRASSSTRKKSVGAESYKSYAFNQFMKEQMAALDNSGDGSDDAFGGQSSSRERRASPARKQSKSTSPSRRSASPSKEGLPPEGVYQRTVKYPDGTQFSAEETRQMFGSGIMPTKAGMTVSETRSPSAMPAMPEMPRMPTFPSMSASTNFPAFKSAFTPTSPAYKPGVPAVPKVPSIHVPKTRPSSSVPSAPGRGAVRSCTNPEYIPGTSKKNPFFETMPSPEVWHRNMPPYFPYGETPFTAREISRQISADLAKGDKESGVDNDSLAGRVVKKVGSFFGRGSISKERPPMWELPPVTDAEVEEALEEIQARHREQNGAKAGSKCKSSATGGASSPKRANRRSSK